jgi:predicted house-cleaning noncanonical NTP pyrophosphatase (MazG superfamily)
MAGRHRAQAVVESVNGIMSRIIQSRMVAEELITKEPAVEWAEDIPMIVKEYNKAYSHKPIVIDPKNNIPIKVNPKNSASDIIEVGTAVRIQLDNPIATDDGRHLHGRFRVGDIRWENKIRHVTQFYLRPNQPPMYKVDTLDVAFTKNQLQIIKENEVMPNSKVQKKFTIDKIMEKLKINNKIVYKVLWTDKDITEEPRTKLIEEVPDLIEEFENNLKLAKQGKEYVINIIDRFKENNKIFFSVEWSNGSKTKISRVELDKIAPRLVGEFEHNLFLSK